ncbi:MAG: MotA/TolQ/ExbB proton channel family protein [Candidatus Symbiothrix sp.]|nr:MotA/TolQ/ExbB proton channel family protein [Candidatus Symbiothrix sp.]
MKRILLIFLFVSVFTNIFFPCFSLGQAPDFLPENTIINEDSVHQEIKTKFIEGSAFFMSFIAFTFIFGLAFCLERIIYLNLSQVNTRKLLSDVETQLNTGNLEEAKAIAQNTRGPVASICYQALDRIDETIEVIDKSVISYGSVQVGLLEKNLSWITLFIAAAPSLGFLGTVIGMIQSFDKIQEFGDINPTIVAGGMKVALITTVGGLVVALVLQFFYNYILNKVEGITGQMEDDSIGIMDMVIKYKKTNKR